MSRPPSDQTYLVPTTPQLTPPAQAKAYDPPLGAPFRPTRHPPPEPDQSTTSASSRAPSAQLPLLPRPGRLHAHAFWKRWMPTRARRGVDPSASLPPEIRVHPSLTLGHKTLRDHSRPCPHPLAFRREFSSHLPCPHPLAFRRESSQLGAGRQPIRRRRRRQLGRGRLLRRGARA